MSAADDDDEGDVALRTALDAIGPYETLQHIADFERRVRASLATLVSAPSASAAVPGATAPFW